MAEEEKKVTKKKSTSTKPKTSTSTKKASTTKKSSTTKKATATKKSTATKATPKKITSTKSTTVKNSTGTKKSTSAKGTTTKKASTTAKKTATKKSTTTKKSTATKKSTGTKKTATTKKASTTKKTTSTRKTTPKKSVPKEEVVIDKNFLNTNEYDFMDVLNTPEDKVDNTVEEVVKEEVVDSTLMDVLNVDEDNINNTVEEKLEREHFKNVLDIDEDNVNNTIEEVIKPEEEIVEEITITEVKVEKTKKTINKNIIKNVICGIVVALLGLLLIFSIYKLISNYSSLNSRLNDKYVYSVDASYREFDIDFKSLNKINKDTVGYVKLNGTNINHIVVRGTDNEYYKSHDFLKKNSKTGWVYMDSSNKLNGTDSNIVIYGKNSKDMFGSLNKVLTKKWLNKKEYHYLTYVAENEEYRYQVFSTYEEDLGDIEIDFDTTSDYMRYLRRIKEKSNYNYNVQVGLYDSIITLVSYDDSRMIVVHAKKVKEEK